MIIDTTFNEESRLEYITVGKIQWSIELINEYTWKPMNLDTKNDYNIIKTFYFYFYFHIFNIVIMLFVIQSARKCPLTGLS